MNQVKTWGAVFIFFVMVFSLSSCNTKKAIKFRKKTIPANAEIAVIIDSPNNLKNVVLIKFLSRGYTVKAVNASDMYSFSDVFDIADLKKMSYNIKGENSLTAMEKTYNNAYKMHIYNFEVNKAELLNEIKTKWNVNYLVILCLKQWGKVSWGRAIDLNTYDVVWIDNYPTAYTDNLETLVDHFIESLSSN